MGIGMVQLDENLIPRLETHHGKWRLDVEYRQRLIAGRGGARRRFGAMPVGPAIAAPPAIVMRLAVVEAERIADPFAVSRAVALTEFPGRPLPHGVVAGLRLGLGVGHPRLV